MKRFYLLILLLGTLSTQFLGCEELGIKTTPTPFDTAETNNDIPLEDFVVTDIDPNFGPPAGGTSVSISGNGFEGDVSVSFGNLELDITIIDAQTIVLETPASPSEGQINVTIESDIGSVTIDDGFNYTNDAPDIEDSDAEDTEDTEDTQSTDTGTPQSSGLTGGLVEIWRKLYACPDCFNPAFPQQVIEASASIHDPVQGSWLSWLPPLNSCVSVLTYPDLGTSLDLGQVSLTGNGASINLSFDSQSGSYINSNVPTTSFQYNTIYGLQSNLVSFQSLLQTPSTPEIVEPAGMLDSQGFVQPFSKSNFAIFWGPTGTTDTILFLLEVYGQNGSYDTITCLTTDSGGLGLDPALLSSFTAEDMLILSLYRMQLTGAIHPDNGSTIEAVSAVGVIGTGYLVE